jgi:hypothetical protein
MKDAELMSVAFLGLCAASFYQDWQRIQGVTRVKVITSGECSLC